MDGTEIYKNFTSGDSRYLQSAAESVQQLADGYNDEASAIQALQTRMNAAWTGSSGDAANAGAGPLVQAFGDSAAPLLQTQGSMQAQSDVFEASKSKVVPVPPAPEKPSGWSVGLKAAIPIVGPSLAVSDVKSYQEGVAKTNAANENNVRVMDQYSSVTGDTKGIIPMDYKTLPSDGASIGLKSASIGSVGSLSSQYNDSTNASSATAANPVGSTMGGGPVSAAPNLNGPSSLTSSTPTTGGTSGSVSPLPNLTGGTSGTGNPTGTSSFVPGVTSGYGGGTGGTQGTGRGTANRGVTGNAGGSAANRLYGNQSEGNGSGRGGGSSAKEGAASRGGSSSAKESVSRGGAAAGESARELGAGKNTGAGKLASAAAAEETAASRSAAKSASGSPMGAAGQRGKGEEDEEHQRPDYLLEADPDAVFGSDVRATPPVIGE